MEVDAPDSVAKSAQPQRKRKQSTSTPVEVGCFDLLRKLACSVQCGGKTLSVKDAVPSYSSSSDISVPEENATKNKRKKSNNSPKAKPKRKHPSRSSLIETDKKANPLPDQHQSLVWAECANMSALDWNMVTTDLQRSVNNLALYVLESMSAPTWTPAFLSELDLTKPPPGYEVSPEDSEMSDEKTPSRQGAKKPPRNKKKMNEQS